MASVSKYFGDLRAFRQNAYMFYWYWIKELKYPRDIAKLILKIGGTCASYYGHLPLHVETHIPWDRMTICTKCGEWTLVRICRAPTRTWMNNMNVRRCIHLQNKRCTQMGQARPSTICDKCMKVKRIKRI